MTFGRLRSIEIENFRSLTKTGEVSLDAPVVLIHGPNGAGKTSLLSGIELALTGEIPSMQRTDSNYKKHLLKYGAEAGRISLTISQDEGPTPKRVVVDLNQKDIRVEGRLQPALAQFFSERCFLAQSTLSQLLTIYQQSNTGIDSPLSAFVRELLGLDKLDALERGLEPALDIRNTRKIVPSLLTVERRRDSFAQEIAQNQGKVDAERALSDAARLELAVLLTQLDMGSLDPADPTISVRLDNTNEREKLSELLDSEIQLDSIERRYSSATTLLANIQRETAEQQLNDANTQFTKWSSTEGRKLEELIQNAAELDLPINIPESDFSPRLSSLTSLWTQEWSRLAQLVQNDIAATNRVSQLRSEELRADARLADISLQLLQSAADIGLLAQALSEIVPHIAGDDCPVCQRDFSEISRRPLQEFVGDRIRQLGDASERQRQLSEERTTLERNRLAISEEIRSLSPTVLVETQRQEIQSRVARIGTILNTAQQLSSEAARGSALAGRATEARQVFDRIATSTSEEAALRSDALTLALSLGVGVAPNEPLSVIVIKLRETLTSWIRQLRATIEQRGIAQERHRLLQRTIETLASATLDLSTSIAAEKKVQESIDSAESIRKKLRQIASVVGATRSQIIGKVFDERLNRIWRDLFVRLAPGEPFVPAFFPPPSGMKSASPVLKTLYRDGGSGGSPGAMLSSGNLNTAALTLFLALNLAVQKKLPWLILDDPVQSMDEVHISQFAALLRTLSKETGRQIFITVHDRSLFDYLTLELSPAFPGDELITIEISPSAEGITRVIPSRLIFKPDTAIVTLAAE